MTISDVNYVVSKGMIKKCVNKLLNSNDNYDIYLVNVALCKVYLSIQYYNDDSYNLGLYVFFDGYISCIAIYKDENQDVFVDVSVSNNSSSDYIDTFKALATKFLWANKPILKIENFEPNEINRFFLDVLDVIQFNGTKYYKMEGCEFTEVERPYIIPNFNKVNSNTKNNLIPTFNNPKDALAYLYKLDGVGENNARYMDLRSYDNYKAQISCYNRDNNMFIDLIAKYKDTYLLARLVKIASTYYFYVIASKSECGILILKCLTSDFIDAISSILYSRKFIFGLNNVADDVKNNFCSFYERGFNLLDGNTIDLAPYCDITKILVSQPLIKLKV